MLLLLLLLLSSSWIRRFDMLPVALYIETTLDIEHCVPVVRVRQWVAYLKADKAPRDYV